MYKETLACCCMCWHPAQGLPSRSSPANPTIARLLTCTHIIISKPGMPLHVQVSCAGLVTLRQTSKPQSRPPSKTQVLPEARAARLRLRAEQRELGAAHGRQRHLT